MIYDALIAEDNDMKQSLLLETLKKTNAYISEIVLPDMYMISLQTELMLLLSVASDKYLSDRFFSKEYPELSKTRLLDLLRDCIVGGTGKFAAFESKLSQYTNTHYSLDEPIDLEGNTLLHYSIIYSSKDPENQYFKCLLQNKASLGVANKSKKTALQQAVDAENEELVKITLSQGAKASEYFSMPSSVTMTTAGLTSETSLLNRAARFFLGLESNSDNLTLFDKWYHPDACHYLLQSANNPAGLIRIMFHDSDGDNIDTFVDQVESAKKLSDHYKKPLVFIAKMPGAQNHFITGILFGNRLMMLNPLGLDDTLPKWKVIAGKIKEYQIELDLYVSDIGLQSKKHESDLVSCGPLATAIAIHIVEHFKKLELGKAFYKDDEIRTDWSIKPEETALRSWKAGGILVKKGLKSANNPQRLYIRTGNDAMNSLHQIYGFCYVSNEMESFVNENEMRGYVPAPADVEDATQDISHYPLYEAQIKALADSKKSIGCVLL